MKPPERLLFLAVIPEEQELSTDIAMESAVHPVAAMQEWVETVRENLQEKAAQLLGRLATSLEPELADAAGIVTMARGGNYKVQRINLQNSGKANSKQPMPPEQKRARKRKRKK